MKKIQPRHIILPGIVLSAIAIFGLSRSVYGHSMNTDHQIVEESPQQTISVGINEKYPASIQQWNNIIIDSGNLYGVDPDLIAAIILLESGGQPRVISQSGAVGLMQVMPRDGTAENFICANGPCFTDRPSIAQLKDPHFNIDYGSRMISELIHQTGSIRSALYAYGPMDVGYTYADQVLSIYRSF